MSTLEKVIASLGEHADNPNFDQLSAATDQVIAGGASIDEIVSVLAFAVAEGFPATPHCRRLLDERPDFILPVLPEVVAPTPLASLKETDPAIREQRRIRREEAKRKKGPSGARPPRAGKTKSASKPVPPAPAAPTTPVVDQSPERRTIKLTPAELERFDPDHALVGAVVIVDVPFDAVDPETPEVKSKDRPALVVAVSRDAVLVRPIFSNPSPTRSTFQPWRRLGLDHVSYIDDVRVALASPSPDSLRRLGRLSDLEWNALL